MKAAPSEAPSGARPFPGLWWWIVALSLLLLAHDWWTSMRAVDTVSYSAFERMLQEGRFQEVEVGDRWITGQLKVPEGGRRRVLSMRVEPDIAQRLSSAGVDYRRVHEPTWLSDLVAWILPLAALMIFWSALARKVTQRFGGAGGLLALGGKTKVYVETSTGVRFDDVAGVDEAKAELVEVVEFLKDPVRHGRLGARVPKGVLLVGPTGTGKTLLARAVAGEAGVPFFSINGSEFIELFVGVGAARVRDLFEQARKSAPAIIFIDEVDALGKARGVFPVSGGHDEREQTLNQLLVELDGFDGSKGVVLLAATNRPEILDPALLRAGRFDRQVLVDRPDRNGRAAILRLHARKVRLGDVDLEEVAALTVGFSGADLANLVNEAALGATRRDASAVGPEDFTRALERILAGVEKKHALVSDRERALVATHELGHALVALALPDSDRVQKVSIVPHGIGTLGYTLQRPAEDRHVVRRSELETQLTVLMGGRAAECLVFGEPSTGAADDLAKATGLARDMVLRYGMEDALGPVSYADIPLPVLGGASAEHGRFGGSDASAARADVAIRALLEAAQQRATALLSCRRQVLDDGVRRLVRQEVMNEAELRALVSSVSLVLPADR